MQLRGEKDNKSTPHQWQVDQCFLYAKATQGDWVQTYLWHYSVQGG